MSKRTKFLKHPQKTKLNYENEYEKQKKKISKKFKVQSTCKSDNFQNIFRFDVVIHYSHLLMSQPCSLSFLTATVINVKLNLRNTGRPNLRPRLHWIAIVAN